MIQRITPMLSYEDVDGAAAWLTRAFGFTELLRYAEPDGRVTHAELDLEGGVVMLAWPGPGYVSPKRHRESCEVARRAAGVPYVIDGVHAYISNVDEHVERARAVGARILSEPEDQPHGDRSYRAEDPEGHRWMFAQRVRRVTPES
jgi:PhnB protein